MSEFIIFKSEDRRRAVGGPDGQNSVTVGEAVRREFDAAMIGQMNPRDVAGLPAHTGDLEYMEGFEAGYKAAQAQMPGIRDPYAGMNDGFGQGPLPPVGGAGYDRLSMEPNPGPIGGMSSNGPLEQLVEQIVQRLLRDIMQQLPLGLEMRAPYPGTVGAPNTGMRQDEMLREPAMTILPHDPAGDLTRGRAGAPDVDGTPDDLMSYEEVRHWYLEEQGLNEAERAVAESVFSGEGEIPLNTAPPRDLESDYMLGVHTPETVDKVLTLAMRDPDAFRQDVFERLEVEKAPDNVLDVVDDLFTLLDNGEDEQFRNGFLNLARTFLAEQLLPAAGGIAGRFADEALNDAEFNPALDGRDIADTLPVNIADDVGVDDADADDLVGSEAG